MMWTVTIRAPSDSLSDYSAVDTFQHCSERCGDIRTLKDTTTPTVRLTNSPVSDFRLSTRWRWICIASFSATVCCECSTVFFNGRFGSDYILCSGDFVLEVIWLKRLPSFVKLLTGVESNAFNFLVIINAPSFGMLYAGIKATKRRWRELDSFGIIT